MLSIKKTLLAAVIIIPLFFVAAARISPYCLDVMTRAFPKRHYFDDSDTTDAMMNGLLLLLAFSLAVFYWNVRVLKSIGRLTAGRLFLECLVDLISVPVGIFIMVILHNSWKHIANLSSLLNPFSLAVFPLCRQTIRVWRLREKRP